MSTIDRESSLKFKYCHLEKNYSALKNLYQYSKLFNVFFISSMAKYFTLYKFNLQLFELVWSSLH